MTLAALSGCQSQGEARLKWDAPTRQEQATRPRVASYRIAWGRNERGPFDLGERLVAPTRTSVTIAPLDAGRYCFVVLSRAANGIESRASNVACKQVSAGPERHPSALPPPPSR